jgi:uncharacterized repeat protein (TIGR03809 family)
MAHPADVARGRNIVARWCNLAERRLDYLTELFETGRWRRFHSEVDFLENIQEAKAAVETWRDLLSREAALDNTAIDMSWLGRPREKPMPLTPLPRDQGLRQPIVQFQPKPAAVVPPRRDQELRQPAVQVQPKPAPAIPAPPREQEMSQPFVHFQPKPAPVVAPREVSRDILIAIESRLAVAEEASSAPDVLTLDEIQFPALDLDAMKDRYPLLRNAL